MFKIGDRVTVNSNNIDLGLRAQLKGVEISETSIGKIVDIVNASVPETYFLVKFVNQKNKFVDFKLYASELKATDCPTNNDLIVKVLNGTQNVVLSFEDGSTQEIDVSEKTKKNYVPVVGDIVANVSDPNQQGVVIEIITSNKCKVAYDSTTINLEFFPNLIFKKSVFD